MFGMGTLVTGTDSPAKTNFVYNKEETDELAEGEGNHQGLI